MNVNTAKNYERAKDRVDKNNKDGEKVKEMTPTTSPVVREQTTPTGVIKER